LINLTPALRGTGVYGEEALDGEEALFFGQLDHMPVRRDHTFYMPGEEPSPLASAEIPPTRRFMLTSTGGRCPTALSFSNARKMSPSTNTAG
jgi:hypothetical protein